MTNGHFLNVKIGDELFALVQGVLFHGVVFRFDSTSNGRQAVIRLDVSEDCISVSPSQLFTSRESAMFTLLQFYEGRAEAIRERLPVGANPQDFWE